MSSWTIEDLDKKRHDRSNFDCGCELLNRFLRELAAQDQRRHFSRTLVATQASTIGGYVTFVPSEMEHRGRRRPVLRLGRMGVDIRHLGNGLGDRLVARTVKAAQEMAEAAACIGVVVDAKRCTNSKPYYERLGFVFVQESEPDADVLFLSIH